MHWPQLKYERVCCGLLTCQRAVNFKPNEDRDRQQWVSEERGAMDEYVRTVLAKRQAPATAPDTFDASAWLQDLVAR